MFCLLSYSTNFIQAVICFCGGIYCLLPLAMSNSTEFRESSANFDLTSQRNRDSAIVAFSLTIPIMVDIVFETFTSTFYGDDSRKIKMHVKQALLNTQERFVLACGILSVPATAFLPSGTQNIVNIYLCLYKCRVILVGGAIIISLCRYDPVYWPVVSTYCAVIFLSLACITGSFADNLYPQHTESVAHSISTLLFFCGSAIFFFCNLRWLITVLPRLSVCLWTRKVRKEGQRSSVSSDLLFPILYVITVTGASMMLTITRRLYPESEKRNAEHLFVHNLGYNIYILFVMYISERMIKYQVVQGLYALIESKKMYVRYISHELRTPLNSAFLGLKLVCDDLEDSSVERDSEHCETLLDVQSACRIAVEILNDLLCFDKLESGILELHKHDVPAITFIEDCVNMFASQAREAGVTIIITTGDAHSYDSYHPDTFPLPLSFSSLPLSRGEAPNNGRGTGMSTCLIDTDTVFMDKFKMDQVLRNLISNALKFTPRGGSVTVCATFVPYCAADDTPLSLSLYPSSSLSPSISEMELLARRPVEDVEAQLEGERGAGRGVSAQSTRGVRSFSAVTAMSRYLPRWLSHPFLFFSSSSSASRTKAAASSVAKYRTINIETDIDTASPMHLTRPSTPPSLGTSLGTDLGIGPHLDHFTGLGSGSGSGMSCVDRIYSDQYGGEDIWNNRLSTMTNNNDNNNDNDNRNNNSSCLFGRGNINEESKDYFECDAVHSGNRDINMNSNTDSDVGRDRDSCDVEAKQCRDMHRIRRNSSSETGSVTCGKLRIVVTDTGAGISLDNQQRLFKEIVQFNPEVLQAGGGSGLGLYITSSIVDMHGGCIRAFSEGAGKGSTFTVEIDMQRWSSPSQSTTVDMSYHSRSHSGSLGTSPYFPPTSSVSSSPPRFLGDVGAIESSSLLGGAAFSFKQRGRSRGKDKEKDANDGEEKMKEKEREKVMDTHAGIIPGEKSCLALSDLQVSVARHMKGYSLAPNAHSASPLSPTSTPRTPPHPPPLAGMDSTAHPKMHTDLDADLVSMAANRPNPCPHSHFVPLTVTIPPCPYPASSPPPSSAYLFHPLSAPPPALASPSALTHMLQPPSPRIENGLSSRRQLERQNSMGGGGWGGECYDVLVVDDSSLNRKLLCRVLRTAGYTCDEADDGLNAIEKVKVRMSRAGDEKKSYDVVLMDFVMPNMDGPTATLAIRAMGYTHPIFGLTGNALDSDIKYFESCGVETVLAKPFDFASFKLRMKGVGCTLSLT